jgi:hypothetical protein
MVRAGVFATAAVIILIGLGFLAYALFLTLIPSVGIVGAAFLIAAICLAVGIVALTALFMRGGPAPVEARVPVETPVYESNTLIKALSELAHDHPIMAVCAAAILGATNNTDRARRR